MAAGRHSLRDQALAFALGLPEAWEDHPWGESVAKVRKKVFVFFGMPEGQDGLHLTVKLRDSHEEAMAMPWVVPAGYGLDRGGVGHGKRSGRRAGRHDPGLDRGELPCRGAEGAGHAPW